MEVGPRVEVVVQHEFGLSVLGLHYEQENQHKHKVIDGAVKGDGASWNLQCAGGIASVYVVVGS